MPNANRICDLHLNLVVEIDGRSFIIVVHKFVFDDNVAQPELDVSFLIFSSLKLRFCMYEFLSRFFP